MDHHDRPELQNGTVDFPAPRTYWSPQPPPTGSLLDTAIDASAANLDALATTASDLLGGLQQSLGQGPSRGPSPAPHKDKDKRKPEPRLRRPQGMARVFVIDVSAPSLARGVVKEVCEGIRLGLYGSKRKGDETTVENGEPGDGEEEEVIGKEERVAVMTVAETVGFWNLSVSVGDSAVPRRTDLFAALRLYSLLNQYPRKWWFRTLMTCSFRWPVASWWIQRSLGKCSRVTMNGSADILSSQIEALLDMLPKLLENSPDGNRVAAGSAVKGALAGLVSPVRHPTAES